MPNGKPGDHPYTDVVIHGTSIFGSPIDDLIRRMAQTGGCPEHIGRLLLTHEPRFGEKTGLDAVEAALRAVLAERGVDA